MNIVKKLLLAFFITSLIYCNAFATQINQAEIESEKIKVNNLADNFLKQYFIRYPEKATYFGINSYGHKDFTDHCETAHKNWHKKEDLFLQIFLTTKF